MPLSIMRNCLKRLWLYTPKTEIAQTFPCQNVRGEYCLVDWLNAFWRTFSFDRKWDHGLITGDQWRFQRRKRICFIQLQTSWSDTNVRSNIDYEYNSSLYFLLYRWSCWLRKTLVIVKLARGFENFLFLLQKSCACWAKLSSCMFFLCLEDFLRCRLCASEFFGCLLVSAVYIYIFNIGSGIR